MSVMWCCTIPRPAGPASSPSTAALRADFARAARAASRRRRGGACAVAAHRLMTLRTDRDWIADVVRFVSTPAPSSAPDSGGAATVSISHFTSAVVAAVPARRRRNRASATSGAAPPANAHLRFSNMELLESVAPDTAQPVAPRADRADAGRSGASYRGGWPARRRTKKVPRNRATVILVIDVSLSMEATDVRPSASRRRRRRPRSSPTVCTAGINLGLVAFAGTASVLVSPTTNHEATKVAIDNLQLAERTATGEGILHRAAVDRHSHRYSAGRKSAPPARIVLMSDGKQTVPDDFRTIDNPRHDSPRPGWPRKSAFPISTISFGTTMGCSGMPSEDGRRSTSGAGRRRVAEQIASLSGGEFFTASSPRRAHARSTTPCEEQIGYETTMGDATSVVDLGRPVSAAVGAVSV